MRVAEYFRHDELDLARVMSQIGVSHGVLRCPETPEGTLIDEKTLSGFKKTFSEVRIEIGVIEPVPNEIHEAIKQALPERDAE